MYKIKKYFGIMFFVVLLIVIVSILVKIYSYEIYLYARLHETDKSEKIHLSETMYLDERNTSWLLYNINIDKLEKEYDKIIHSDYSVEKQKILKKAVINVAVNKYGMSCDNNNYSEAILYCDFIVNKLENDNDNDPLVTAHYVACLLNCYLHLEQFEQFENKYNAYEDKMFQKWYYVNLQLAGFFINDTNTISLEKRKQYAEWLKNKIINYSEVDSQNEKIRIYTVNDVLEPFLAK